MFGYVRASAGELRVREHEYYKGTYCGLCRAMGKCTGQCSRMSLSYDVLLLSLVRILLMREPTSFEQRRCPFHPLKKRNMMKRNETLDLSARVSALLTYHKVKDDIADSGFVRRTLTRIFLLPFASSARRRAIKRDPTLRELDLRMTEHLSRLTSFEKERIASADIPAEIFGELLADIVSFGLGGSERKIAENIGKSIGKWIYIADALDDMSDDIRSGNYNSLVEIYGGCLPSDEQIGDVAAALKNELMRAERALELADFDGYETVKNILFNILYLGMPEKIHAITQKYQDTQERYLTDE